VTEIDAGCGWAREGSSSRKYIKHAVLKFQQIINIITIFIVINYFTPAKKTEVTVAGIRRADHATPLYPLKLALTSQTSGGLSAGIVRSRTKATELLLLIAL
jgi:hypothetical protein